MRILLTSQYRAVAVSIINVLVIGLALLVVIGRQGLSERSIAASLLILCFIVFCVGGVLYTGRAILKWQIEDTSSHLIWERGSIIVATLATIMGLVLLGDMLHDAGQAALAQLGTVVYLFGAVLVVVAETTYLSNSQWNYTQVVVYVVLAFLAEAAFGAALIQTEIVAAWVGWATIIWNIGWLLAMFIFRPRDIYFPVLHYVAPLIIGIALLTQG